jgi:chromosome segregation ATPase
MSSVNVPQIGEAGPSNWYEAPVASSSSLDCQPADSTTKKKKKKKKTRPPRQEEESRAEEMVAILSVERISAKRETQIAHLKAESERLSTEAMRLDEQRKRLDEEAASLEVEGVRMYKDALARVAANPTQVFHVGEDVIHVQQRTALIKAELESWKKDYKRLKAAATRVEKELLRFDMGVR